MAIEKKPFSIAPFVEADAKRGRKVPTSPEILAVLSLDHGEMVQFPCRWKHGQACHGATAARNAARKAGFRVMATCNHTTVTVGRLPREVE